MLCCCGPLAFMVTNPLSYYPSKFRGEGNSVAVPSPFLVWVRYSFVPALHG